MSTSQYCKMYIVLHVVPGQRYAVHLALSEVSFLQAYALIAEVVMLLAVGQSEGQVEVSWQSSRKLLKLGANGGLILSETSRDRPHDVSLAFGKILQELVSPH